ncbi:hypothetical protein F5B19DRAFT_461040, partial [Rostrohypoxylon terebratum]
NGNGVKHPDAAAPTEAPPKKKLKTASAPTEPVPVANNGVEEDEFDEDGLGEEEELEGDEEEDTFEDELEGEAEGDEEENGVDEPKKLGIDVDAPTKEKTQTTTEVAANGEEAED